MHLSKLLFEMAPSVSVNFTSLVTSYFGFKDEEPQTAFLHVLYMGISYSRSHANGMLNSTQSINVIASLSIKLLSSIETDCYGQCVYDVNTAVYLEYKTHLMCEISILIPR